MPSWRSVRMPSFIAVCCSASARAPVWIRRRSSRETTIISWMPARPLKPVWSHFSQPGLLCSIRRPSRLWRWVQPASTSSRVTGGSAPNAFM